MINKVLFTVIEVKNLINKIQISQNLSLTEISEKLDVSTGILSKWKNGKKPISEINFLKLKQLAGGQLPQQSQGISSPINSSMERVMGRLEQITEQLTDVLSRVAVIENEISLKKKVQTVQSAMKVEK